MPSKLIFLIICSTIVLCTLLYGAVHQPILSLFYLGTALILILWVFDSISMGQLRYNTHPLQIPIIATILYGIIQIIPFGYIPDIAGVRDIPNTISIDPFATKLSIMHFFALLVYFSAVLTFVDSAKRLKKLVTLIIVFGFLYSFYAILQSVLSPGKIYGIYEIPLAQPFGSFVNRHNFAAFMEMSLAIPLGMLFAGAVPKDKRLLYITAITLMSVALLLSGSRGGLVAFFAELLFLIFITTDTRGSSQMLLKIALVIIFLFVTILGTIFVGGESTLTRIAETAQSSDVTTNRLHIWSVTLKIISHYPIFGVGLGAFPQAYTKFDSLSGLERVEQAHNDYLQILADAGIFGLVFASLFVFYLVKTGIRSIKEKNNFRRAVAIGALSGCFAILVHSIFDFVLHVTAIAVMFLTLCAIVVTSGSSFPDDDPDKKRRKRKRKQKAELTAIDNPPELEGNKQSSNPTEI